MGAHTGRCFRDRRRTAARKQRQADDRASLQAAKDGKWGNREVNKYGSPYAFIAALAARPRMTDDIDVIAAALGLRR